MSDTVWHGYTSASKTVACAKDNSNIFPLPEDALSKINPHSDFSIHPFSTKNGSQASTSSLEHAQQTGALADIGSKKSGGITPIGVLLAEIVLAAR